MPLLSLLLLVLILCVLYWAIHRLTAAFGLSPQVVAVLDVLLVVLLVLSLVGWLWPGVVPLRLR